MPPRKKRAKMGTPSLLGLVTSPASVLSFTTTLLDVLIG
jgi:hypothetical protein